MKLEVGMYVRIQNGLNIVKVLEIDFKKETFLGLHKDNIKIDVGFWNIKVSSFNLIDLIESGDYVNGRKISAMGEGDIKFIIFEDNAKLEMTVEENIKSIVTKEQFKSVEYEVSNE